ncbi:hypothetical protein F2P56_027003 [Juglans regia]|uniref:Classical arabinogalactan protein 9-like n=2 Tax=Juglans regia TaxID=51240 RepID=A0A2I4ET94_JUGRE|nr:classical arabinogalactan protein 9-like [Juglans regia]KAF5451952.1 hypothetical protein F2P56_027003 [Juglans regia]
MGYSPDHKGYNCLNISTGCVYLSRDVIFREDIFSFAVHNPLASSSVPSVTNRPQQAHHFILPQPLSTPRPISPSQSAIPTALNAPVATPQSEAQCPNSSSLPQIASSPHTSSSTSSFSSSSSSTHPLQPPPQSRSVSPCLLPPSIHPMQTRSKNQIHRPLLHTDVCSKWPLHQWDVQNAFLYGDLEEAVFMKQPLGFVNPDHPHHLCWMP